MSKGYFPSLTLSSSTTCPANGDIPWTKGVHSNSRKWWPRSKTVLGQIGHFLDFNLTTKFATQHTSPDECRNEPLSRRITAIRGPIKIFRSDRGTNFIGATDQIGIKSINVEDTKVKQHLDNTGSVWKFNSPHSSHMGGVWERMIGITRRILDGILLQQNKKALTHEVLSTLGRVWGIELPN
jgi:hypothetical protein